jgi:hypothetical protein
MNSFQDINMKYASLYVRLFIRNLKMCRKLLAALHLDLIG